MEYDNTEYMNLGTVMVANATRDLVHDSSHTENTRRALVECQVSRTSEHTNNPETCGHQGDQWMAVNGLRKRISVHDNRDRWLLNVWDWQSFLRLVVLVKQRARNEVLSILYASG